MKRRRGESSVDHREFDSRSRAGTVCPRPWPDGSPDAAWSKRDWRETLRESISSGCWASFGGADRRGGTKSWSYPGGSHSVESRTASNSAPLATERGSIFPKLLLYPVEIERDFEVLPSPARVGMSDSKSNCESGGMGDAEPTDQGANPSRRRRVQVLKRADGGVGVASAATRSWSWPCLIVSAFESSSAQNSVDRQSGPLRVHDREIGERS